MDQILLFDTSYLAREAQSDPNWSVGGGVPVDEADSFQTIILFDPGLIVIVKLSGYLQYSWTRKEKCP